MIELGWVKFRSSSGSALHCRLGGDFGPGGNGAPDEDNVVTIAAFLGKSAPQLPTSTFGPGCAVGHSCRNSGFSCPSRLGRRGLRVAAESEPDEPESPLLESFPESLGLRPPRP